VAARRGKEESPIRARRLETASLVVGYAMSRLDTRFLSVFGLRSWDGAFATFAKVLDVKPKSIKNLRDEFDPIFPNPRKGWWKRKMNASRVVVADALELTSDAALIVMVREILEGREAEVAQALDLLAPRADVAAAAVERLATGRLAEKFVMENCRRVLGHEPAILRDAREDLAGFDFELRTNPSVVVEVKGLSGRYGDLLFTDREWFEAQRRRERYWLVVVGLATTRPEASVLRDPSQRLEVRCLFEQSVRATWRTRFGVQHRAALADMVAEPGSE
jgi:hypothetical protein